MLPWGWRNEVRRIERVSRWDMDLVFIGLTVLFFALSGWLISALEKL
jgi:hypothetical protein